MEILKGVKVVELPGLAPVPFCGLILSNFGAEVTFIQKTGRHGGLPDSVFAQKNVVSVDFETEKEKLIEMILESDVLLDPFRPGVLEAIGLDPVELMRRNGRLIVARISGYGQFGEMASKAGHDINYVAMSGAMPLLSGPNRPFWPPANLLADFAGGGLLCAFGICAALYRREKSGEGFIVDVSMTEGVAYLASFLYGTVDKDIFWNADFGFFSGRSPIYRTYETKDGKFLAVGALEPKFHNQLFNVLGVDPANADMGSEMERIFKRKTRAEWTKIFDQTDCCVTPVLEHSEVYDSVLHKSRNAFSKVNGVVVPQAAPRFYTKDQFERKRQKSKI